MIASAWVARGSLGCLGSVHLSSLVLGDLVLGVLVALLGLAVRPAGFRNVDLNARRLISHCCCGMVS